MPQSLSSISLKENPNRVSKNFVSILLPVALIFLIAGCNKRPAGVLGDKEMVELMADMQVAEAYMQNHNAGYASDSIRDSAVQWALDRRGLTKAQFDSTMTWYGKNIDEYRDLFAKVDKELLNRQKKIPGETEETVDISDLWPYSRHILISENGSSNSLTFSIQTDQLTKGDRINWKMHLNGSPSVNMLLGVDYDNGTSAYSYQNNSDAKKMDVSLQTDTSLNVSRIFGYLRVKEDRYLPVWIDSISLQSSPIDSTQYYRVFSQRKIGKPQRKIDADLNDEDNDSIKKADQTSSTTDLSDNNAPKISGKVMDSKNTELHKTGIKENGELKTLPKRRRAGKESSLQKIK